MESWTLADDDACRAQSRRPQGRNDCGLPVRAVPGLKPHGVTQYAKCRLLSHRLSGPHFSVAD